MRHVLFRSVFLAGLLAVSARPAAAVTYITVNIPVDVDNLDPSITTVTCSCYLRAASTGGIAGPTLSPVGPSTVGTVTRGSFHGTLTATLGDTTAPLDAFLRAATVECMLNLNATTGISYQPGSSTVPYTTGPAAPKPGTKFRAKIVLPLASPGTL